MQCVYTAGWDIHSAVVRDLDDDGVWMMLNFGKKKFLRR